MELRHLRYFVAAVEAGTVTRAAERLGIQQPPLSMQLRALERELGAQLLERTPRGVVPTEAGLVLLAEARAVLAGVAQATARVAAIKGGLAGRLALGVTTSAVVHPAVPQLIRAFRAGHPKVVLDMREDNAAGLTRAVQEGELAAAIMRQPVSRAPQLAWLELARERMVLVVPCGDARSGGVRLAELAGDPFVLVRLPGAPGMYGSLLQACRDAGFEPAVAAEVPHMLTAVSLVAAGLGVTVVPESMARVQMPEVRYLRLEAPGLQAPLSMAYADANRSVLLARLVAVARQLVAAGWAIPNHSA